MQLISIGQFHKVIEKYLYWLSLPSIGFTDILEIKMCIRDRYNIVKSNHPPIPSHSRVSRRHRLLSPKSSHFLFNSSSPATVQKPVNFISHICGLGASVGCERVERTFSMQRLKAQIWLMKFTGFVCSLSNELNSDS